MSLIAVGILMPLVSAAAGGALFPAELISFRPYAANPLFEGGGPGTWDEAIRERGWILKEGDTYHLWYTGYAPGNYSEKHLGYATSSDGIAWTRHPDNPIYSERWVEDMMVLKQGETYYMFAEGANDEAQLLTSRDRVHWTWEGRLDVRLSNGTPLPPGPFGTPSVYFEQGTWYLFYEREDEAIWLATSNDLATWTNVQDEPVIRRGPELYDRTMIAMNQVIKSGDRYYAYYHATCPENGKDQWTMNIAVSDDLIHWKKYAGNPVIGANHSSGFLVHDGERYRMYCLHPRMFLFWSSP
ncbi:MAG: hypothetical protein AMXMBFR84_44730 [Candidatus Hydrogenedentota bacterium]